jgi:hypothetical protein
MRERERERERERKTFSEIFQQRPAFCAARRLAAAVNVYFIDIRRRRIEGWKRHFPKESCVDAGGGVGVGRGVLGRREGGRLKRARGARRVLQTLKALDWSGA